MRNWILFLATILPLGLFAQNGLEITMQNSLYDSFGGSIKNQKSNTIWIKGQKLKIASDKPDEPVMIFNGQKEEMIILFRDKSQFAVLNKSDLAKINLKLDEAQKRIESEISMMPAEQQKIMREQMKSMFESNTATTINYELSNESQQISSYATKKFIGSVSNEIIEEIFIASMDQFEIEKSDFAIYSTMMDFMRVNMSSLFKTIPGNPNGNVKQQDHPGFKNGIPVKTVNYVKGKKHSEETLQTLNKIDLPDEALEVTPGFKKIDLLKDMEID